MMEIANLDQFRARLARLVGALDDFSDIASAQLQDRLHQALLMLAGHASVYPPPPPNSQYRRTRTLGRTWTAARPEIVSGSHLLEARIGNNTVYGARVQGPETQAAIHRGRWKTTDQIVEEHVGEVEHYVAQAGPEIVGTIASRV